MNELQGIDRCPIKQRIVASDRRTQCVKRFSLSLSVHVHIAYRLAPASQVPVDCVPDLSCLCCFWSDLPASFGVCCIPIVAIHTP